MRLEIREWVLRLGVRFADTWKPQLEAIRSFLVQKGINLPRIGKDENRAGNRRTAYRLDIHETRSVIIVLRAMERHCVKRREDIRIALGYLEDRITAEDAVARFNDQTRIGRRRGIVHTASIPYKKTEGHRLYELTNAKRARDAHFIRLQPELEEKIKGDHQSGGLSIVKLSRKYGYSQSVIRRILGRL